MDPNRSIDELVLKARKLIKDRGYSAGYRYNYHWIWKKFRLYTKGRELLAYSSELGMEFYFNWLGHTSITATTRKDESKFRAMKVLDDIFHDKPLKKKYTHKLVHIPERYLPEYNAYLNYLIGDEQKPRTIATKISRLLVLLRYLENEAITLSNFSFQVIERFYTHISVNYNKTAQANIKFTIRDFLKFGSASGFVPIDSDRFVGVIYGNKHERLPSTYTKEETQRILLAVDRTSLYGKRDYAILVLLIQLGIRRSDICYLTLESIRPEDHSITFVQQKTGTYEKLPMTISMELALADYLKNARPETPSNRLFVILNGVYKGTSFCDATIYAILNKYMRIAEIATEGKRHGTHSMRHSLSSNLLKDGIELPVISRILGHSSSEITTRYLWMDTEQMRNLSLEVPYAE
jgi:site-specific recombinase XerD